MGETTAPARAGRRRWRWALGTAAAVVLLGLAVAVALVLWPRSPTAITEEEAIERFHQSTVPGRTGTGPTAGVYTYDADGTEMIDMGPLPLPTRDIPATVTVAVRPDGACWDLDLNLMVEHTESTRLCVDADGRLSLPSQTKAEKVPGFSVGIRNHCDPAVVLDPEATELPIACHETFDVSGLGLAVDFTGTATASPGGTVTVGGEPVETVHLRLELTGTGDLSGHWIEEWWLDADDLPVRMARDIDLDGPGHFVERSTLTVRDLRPRA